MLIRPNKKPHFYTSRKQGGYLSRLESVKTTQEGARGKSLVFSAKMQKCFFFFSLTIRFQSNQEKLFYLINTLLLVLINETI